MAQIATILIMIMICFILFYYRARNGRPLHVHTHVRAQGALVAEGLATNGARMQRPQLHSARCSALVLRQVHLKGGARPQLGWALPVQSNVINFFFFFLFFIDTYLNKNVLF